MNIGRIDFILPINIKEVFVLRLRDEIIKFRKDDTIIREKNNRVLMYNKKFKRHIMQSSEVYSYIKEAEDRGLKIGEFVEMFDDREYMKNLIINMARAGILDTTKYEMFYNDINRGFNAIYLAATHKCNLECRHCCTSCSSGETDILTTDDVKSIMDFIAELNPQELIITGGEPMIRSDFYETIEYFKSKECDTKLVLSTNATLINESNVSFIAKNFERVEISIDGVDEETCSMIRGKGVFSKIMRAIVLLHTKGFRNIRTSMVVGDKNRHWEERFHELNEKMGTRGIVRCFEPDGRGAENASYFISEDSILPFEVTKLDNLKFTKEKDGVKSCSCDMFKSKMFIDYDGNMYPCQSLIKPEYLYGSALDKDNRMSVVDFDYDISNSDLAKKLQRIMPYNFEKCKDCDLAVFCFGCPAMVDKIIDKENCPDYERWCSIMKPQLNRLVWGVE